MFSEGDSTVTNEARPEPPFSADFRFDTYTMCHCDDPDDCLDHWSVGVVKEWGSDGEHARRASPVVDGTTGPIARWITYLLNREQEARRG